MSPPSLLWFLYSRGVDAHSGPDCGRGPAGVLLHPGSAHPGRSGVPDPPLEVAAVCCLCSFPHLFPLFLVRPEQSGWEGAPVWPRPHLSLWEAWGVQGRGPAARGGAPGSRVHVWLWGAPVEPLLLAWGSEHTSAFTFINSFVPRNNPTALYRRGTGT